MAPMSKNPIIEFMSNFFSSISFNFQLTSTLDRYVK
jgi:hypothetical protein